MKEALTKGRCLDLGGILKDLVSDGVLEKSDAVEIAAARRSREQALLHPLEIIAAKQCLHRSHKTPLNLDYLSRWLAKKAGIPLAHIDPLKIKCLQSPRLCHLPVPSATAFSALRSVARRW